MENKHKRSSLVAMIPSIIVAILLIVAGYMYFRQPASTIQISSNVQNIDSQESTATISDDNVNTKFYVGKVENQEVHIISGQIIGGTKNHWVYGCVYIRDNIDDRAQNCDLDFSSGGRYSLNLTGYINNLVGYECDLNSLNNNSIISICSDKNESAGEFKLIRTTEFEINFFAKKKF